MQSSNKESKGSGICIYYCQTGSAFLLNCRQWLQCYVGRSRCPNLVFSHLLSLFSFSWFSMPLRSSSAICTGPLPLNPVPEITLLACSVFFLFPLSSFRNWTFMNNPMSWLAWTPPTRTSSRNANAVKSGLNPAALSRWSWRHSKHNSRRRKLGQKIWFHILELQPST